ncbi:101 kDa malaria antigen [Cocos nucifera]|uniref:101 kDa malaria antigen n=1 Tax=Cocos nucifera TaxID=13894 RepID=A0A8K0IF69_COCNU|nr:101 kDa malaria antigen [Cocos nucifera]
MEHEIRDMISKLTHQLTALGGSTAWPGQENEEGDHGVRIITLAGDNKGATMKANLEEMMDTHGALHDDERAMSAYTNSNYQAVNNSILLGGSCNAEDPGVHIVISDHVDDHGDSDQESHEKKEKEKKEKEKEGSKGETHSKVEQDEKRGNSE